MAKPKDRVWVFDNISKYCTYSGTLWMPLGFFSGSSGKTEQEWEIGEWCQPSGSSRRVIWLTNVPFHFDQLKTQLGI